MRLPFLGVLGVRFICILAAAFLAACAAPTARRAVSAPGDTRQILFNDGWRFQLADAPGAQDTGFDDSAWRRLNLPHDWSIEQPFDANLASGTGFLPGGIAWYRKHFTLAPDQQGQTLLVRFDGVYKNSTVYLNGQKVGQRPFGYISFECDLTPFVRQAGDNVLAVRVDHHDYADSRWYPGSGIYRNVYLTAVGPVRVDRYGTFVTTPKVAKDSATIRIDTTVRNDGAEPQYVVLDHRLLDPQGRHVDYPMTADPDRPITVPAHGTKVITREMTIDMPRLWTLDQPAMYTVVTHVGCPKGCEYDAYVTPFGIRNFSFDPDKGFSLNGTPMKLKGVCLHHDAGALGAAVPRQVWERRLMLLRAAGVNAIRCSHNPPAPEFLDLCDRLGFLVMDEAFDEWSGGKKKWVDTWSGTVFKTDGYHSDFDQWADADIKDMVLRDRNHPSIIMWSIGNEVDYANDPFPPRSEELRTAAKRLIADVKAVDTTRPVTAACAAIATNLWYQDLDIIGYNYQESRYQADHAALPGRVIFGSENGQDLAAWNAVADNPFISAQFLWTGIDYMGEAGRPAPNKAWPERSRPNGILDLAAFPKPAYYFRKSLWTEQPMVKLELSSSSNLECYTNCDAVEFFQNGKSLGEESVPKSSRVIRLTANYFFHAAGRVPLPGSSQTIQVSIAESSGPLKAVGKKDGKAVVEDIFVRPGDPARISLNEYRSMLGPGDGPNVAQIELSLVDAAGVLARDAGNEIAVAIKGPGRLMAMESGDISSHENYQAPNHKAFHGRLLIFVETAGKVTVTATTGGLPEATIQVGG